MITVRKINISDITQADYLKEYSRLSDIKTKYISGLRPEDKRRSLAGLILLRQLVNEVYKTDDYLFSYNENGKPMLDFCFFSISHSADYAICAVSDKPVGLDIELMRSISIRDDYRLFSLEEVQFVNSDPDLHDRNFFEIWTKKEAYIKMKGLSLADGAWINTFKITDASFKTDVFDGYMMTLCCSL